jgi:hypothetical protein
MAEGTRLTPADEKQHQRNDEDKRLGQNQIPRDLPAGMLSSIATSR